MILLDLKDKIGTKFVFVNDIMKIGENVHLCTIEKAISPIVLKLVDADGREWKYMEGDKFLNQIVATIKCENIP